MQICVALKLSLFLISVMIFPADLYQTTDISASCVSQSAIKRDITQYFEEREFKELLPIMWIRIIRNYLIKGKELSQLSDRKTDHSFFFMGKGFD